MMESDAEAMPESFYQAQARKAARVKRAEKEVVDSEDEDLPEDWNKILRFGKERIARMYFKAQKKHGDEHAYQNDLRLQDKFLLKADYKEKLDLSAKEHDQTKTKLAETEAKLAEKEAKLAETEAELADTKDELADLQAKHARVCADYDKHWDFVQDLKRQLTLVLDELNVREESGNHPQELIDRAKAQNAEHQAELDQLLKQGKVQD
jgi:hypothetical protein